MKQVKKDFEFIKEKKNKKRNYIFQKNNLTKAGFYIVISVIAFSFLVFIKTSTNLF